MEIWQYLAVSNVNLVTGYWAISMVQIRLGSVANLIGLTFDITFWNILLMLIRDDISRTPRSNSLCSMLCCPHDRELPRCVFFDATFSHISFSALRPWGNKAEIGPTMLTPGRNKNPWAICSCGYVWMIIRQNARNRLSTHAIYPSCTHPRISGLNVVWQSLESWRFHSRSSVY